MSGIPAIGPNFRSKISFKAEENKPKTEEQQPTEEEGMSKNTKIGVAVGAAVALAALGYAGYKGHLGKGLQKMLGGAEKAADDLKVKTEVPDAKPNGADAAPKTEEQRLVVNKSLDTEQVKGTEINETETPITKIATEVEADDLDTTPLVKSLTIEQRRGVLRDILPDAPVLVSIVERSGLLEKIDEIPNKHNFTIKKLNNFVSEMFSEIKKTPGDELIFNELVGKNSLLFKKINEITIGDLNGLPEKISKSEYLAEKLKSGDKTFDLASDFSELAKKLDSNTTLDKLIKMLYKDVEFEPEKTGVEYIADYIQAQLKGLS